MIQPDAPPGNERNLNRGQNWWHNLKRKTPGADSSPACGSATSTCAGFIQQNYTPYDGDATFLAQPTQRTTRRSGRSLRTCFVEERKKGVLDVSQVPSSITAHAPGYIDRDNEVIVGLQTDAPLKRAIMPNGGLRMVLSVAQGVRLRTGPGGCRDVHQVSQDAQRGSL